MRHSLSLQFLVLALGCRVLSAQSPASGSGAILIAPPSSLNCPIGISVERRSQSEVARIRQDAKPKFAPGQGLDLIFRNSAHPAINAVDLTVHAYSLQSRPIPAAAATLSGGNMVTRTFHLHPSSERTTPHSNIWVSDISTIGWIELTSIEYSDGTSWHQSAESRCSATPGVMLVGSTAAPRP